MELNQMNLLNQDTTTSPFDAIKQTDGANEWWSARDLMPLLGYDKWERFSGAIDRARQVLVNQGVDPDGQASRVREAFGRTNQIRENYHLSRYAAYLVAMNADPRKAEVAAAQSYFAIRTREAEVAKPRELTRLELIDMAREAEVGRLEAEQRREVAEAQVRELTPAASAWTQFLSSTGDFSVNEAAKALSRNSAHVVGERRLRSLMESWNWIYRDYKRRPRAYQAQIDNGRLAERARTHQNPITGELVQDVPQVRVTAKGLDAIRDLLSSLDR